MCLLLFFISHFPLHFLVPNFRVTQMWLPLNIGASVRSISTMYNIGASMRSISTMYNIGASVRSISTMYNQPYALKLQVKTMYPSSKTDCKTVQ